ncbi:hypothetical protein DXG01_008186 [Tephrocybe rancida]|nr:hypothetical protein DXG01_008186 [Tephrocybe rancida]
MTETSDPLIKTESIKAPTLELDSKSLWICTADDLHINAISFSVNATYMATASQNGLLLNDIQAVATFLGPPTNVYMLQYNPSGTQIAAAYSDQLCVAKINGKHLIQETTELLDVYLLVLGDSMDGDILNKGILPCPFEFQVTQGIYTHVSRLVFV